MIPTSLALLVLATLVYAQIDPQLTGTWSTKSNSTLTGPAFYDPTQEKLIEPAHTGISYSFTDDGFYESAYYRAISNPTTPSCPKAMMQWQHGTFSKSPDGSLTLQPIAVDGRQLTSDPCTSKYSAFVRYNVTENFHRYEILTDPYSQNQRLNLYRFDGSPLPPMYLAFRPPSMLPTTTLTPPKTMSSAHGAKATGSKLKRALHLDGGRRKVDYKPIQYHHGLLIDADRLWWFGISLTGVGSLLYFYF